MNSFDNETPLEHFKVAAVRYGKAIENGNKVAATNCARDGRAAKELLLVSEQGKLNLLGLLNDEDPWVRYAAAASVIDVEPETAQVVLNELQSRPGSIGAVAFTALRMWETRTSAK